MKLTISLGVIIQLVLLTFTLSTRISNKIKNVALEKTDTSSEITQNVKDAWTFLFTQPRGVACDPSSQNGKSSWLDNLPYGARRNRKGMFPWVQAWGYENSAYFFDYLDPVLRDDVITSFKIMYDGIVKGPRELKPKNSTKTIRDHLGKEKIVNTTYVEYDDPFEWKIMDAKQKADINMDVYNVSISAVQIYWAIEQWHWNFNTDSGDPVKRLIQLHDFNGDGRLSPREFLIMVLRNFKKIYTHDECLQCFRDVVPKIDAIFKFMDCDNNGLVSSEDLYEHLPTLIRKTDKWNYFKLANRAKIRSHVTNDFVLKNNLALSGMLTKKEFRVGIFLGFWDRQTTDLSIMSGDERTMKNLRWKDNMIDIKAIEYIDLVKKIAAETKDKEREEKEKDKEERQRERNNKDENK